MERIIRQSEEGEYAVGYFEAWNIESIEGVIDAAEETNSPMIIGYNGDFMSHDGRRAKERLAVWVAMAKAAAETSEIPCALVLNECPKMDWIKESIDLGFNLVLPVDESATYEEYVKQLQDLVPYAQKRGAAVEAELGELPCGASGEIRGEGELTDPAVCGRFVQETGIDLLAVSVGNVHIQVNANCNGNGDNGLDMARLAAIRECAGVPLVLHGGTGISHEALREAISLGVRKVNYGTYLKQRYLTAVREAMKQERSNPHELLGLGEDPDIMVTGRLAVRDAVLERIETLGCCGKAWETKSNVVPSSHTFDKGLAEAVD
jgi:ketose-bisphosphate aldolase